MIINNYEISCNNIENDNKVFLTVSLPNASTERVRKDCPWTSAESRNDATDFNRISMPFPAMH